MIGFWERKGSVHLRVRARAEKHVFIAVGLRIVATLDFSLYRGLRLSFRSCDDGDGDGYGLTMLYLYRYLCATYVVRVKSLPQLTCI